MLLFHEHEPIAHRLFGKVSRFWFVIWFVILIWYLNTILLVINNKPLNLDTCRYRELASRATPILFEEKGTLVLVDMNIPVSLLQTLLQVLCKCFVDAVVNSVADINIMLMMLREKC